MKFTKKLYFTLLFLSFIFSQNIFAQDNEQILSNQEVKKQINITLRSIYNWEFVSSQQHISNLEKMISADHPSVLLLKAILVYWEYTPLPEESKETSTFFELLDKVESVCEDRIDADDNDHEAYFYITLAKSMKMRQYNAVGSTFSAVGEAKPLYGLVRKGMERQDQFNEFYFTSGIYNYYREAFPEQNPIYKPFAYFFPKGDKQKGIEQLKYASENCVFTRSEAQRYLITIYIVFEQDTENAVILSESFIKEYPQNLFFVASHLFTLLKADRVLEGEQYLAKLFNSNKPFYMSIAHAFKGYIEWEKGNPDVSFDEYKKAEEYLAKEVSGSQYIGAFIYAELYRYHHYKGDKKQAKDYEKKALACSEGKANIKRVKDKNDF